MRNSVLIQWRFGSCTLKNNKTYVMMERNSRLNKLDSQIGHAFQGRDAQAYLKGKFTEHTYITKVMCGNGKHIPDTANIKALKKRKYRLGNQPEEFRFITRYLGWHPKGFNNWGEWCDQIFQEGLGKNKEDLAQELILASPKGVVEVKLILDHQIIKDAFPMQVFGEERFKNWHQFYIVALEDRPEEKFIIPMH